MNYIYKDKLETKRLLTRFVTIDDIDSWTSFFEDEECVRFFPSFGLATARARSEHWVKRCLERYEQKIVGLQALIDKETGEFIGQCGLLLQEVDGIKEVEIGYHLFKKHWGKGYAVEAAQAFKEYAFHHKLATSIISIININNAASQKVAVRNGMKQEKQCKWNNMDVFIYRI